MTRLPSNMLVRAGEIGRLAGRVIQDSPATTATISASAAAVHVTATGGIATADTPLPAKTAPQLALPADLPPPPPTCKPASSWSLGLARFLHSPWLIHALLVPFPLNLVFGMTKTLPAPSTDLSPPPQPGKLGQTPKAGDDFSTHAPPAVPDAKTLVNGFLANTIEAGQNRLGEQFEHRPHKVLGALALLHKDLDLAWIVYKLFKIRPEEGGPIAEELAAAFFADERHAETLAKAAFEWGIRHFLDNPSAKSPDEVESLERVERAVVGSVLVREIIETFFEEAVQAGQTLGLEVEFRPQKPAGNREDLFFRNEVYELLAAAAQNGGSNVALIRGPNRFIYNANCGIFPILYILCELPGRGRVLVRLLQGSGAKILTITGGGPDDSNSSPIGEDRENGDLFDLVPDAFQVLAAHFSITPDLLQAEIRAAEAQGGEPVRIHATTILKDRDNDMLMVDTQLEGTAAVLTATNGEFIEPDGSTTAERRIPLSATNPIEQLREASQVVARMLNQGDGDFPLATKKEDIVGLQYAGYKKPLDVLLEAPPDLEAVTPKMKAGDIEIFTPTLDILANNGMEGTRPANVVGIHIHAGISFWDRRGIPNTEPGRPNIAPLVNVMRAFLIIADDLTGLIPTHKNRLAFVQPRHKLIAPFFLQEGYFVEQSDPMANLLQVLRILADLVLDAPKKYTMFNLDNAVSLFGAELMLGEKMPDGSGRRFEPLLQPNRQYHVKWTSITGETYQYQFTTRWIKNSPDAPPSVDIEVVRVIMDPVSEQTRQNDSHIVRIQRGAWKPTVELRSPDTVLASGYAKQLLQFVAAFVHGFARSDTLSVAHLYENIREFYDRIPEPYRPAIQNRIFKE